MYKGMYVAMAGSLLRSQELDNVSNNLANVSTTGYKRMSFSSRLYPLLEGLKVNEDSLFPAARSMATAGETVIDSADGILKTTGNSLDLAVRGEGFFAVEEKGQKYYTRNGSFSLDRDGFIVTARGGKVLDGSDKPIRLGEGAIAINGEGTVTVNGTASGKIKLVKIEDLRYRGDALFTGRESGTAKGEVVQGSVEMSNVNPVREMVGIINAMRQYEMAQRVMQSFNELTQRTVTEIAKV
jgi:flagellar basal-body rod protein FlgG